MFVGLRPVYLYDIFRNNASIFNFSDFFWWLSESRLCIWEGKIENSSFQKSGGKKITENGDF